MKQFLLILLIALLPEIVVGQNDSTVNTQPTKLTGYPVVLNNDTAFYFYLKLGSLSAKERAERLSYKFKNLVRQNFVISDSITIVETESTSDIVYFDYTVTAVSDAEAAYEKKTRQQLASERMVAIKAAFKKVERQFNIKRITYRAISLAVILILLYIFIKYFRVWEEKFKVRFFVKLDKYFTKKNLIERSNQYRDRQHKIFDIIFNVIYYGVILLLIYGSLPFLFKMFPQTKSYGDKLLSLTLNPIQNVLNGFIDYIPNAITIVVTFFIFRLIMRALKFIANEVHTNRFKIPGFYEDWAFPTYHIIRFFLYIFFFIITFPYLPGSDSEVFKGFSVFLGLLISIGSSSAISNMMSGLVITYMRPFLLGDRVKIGETTGDVIEKSMLVTRIKTIKNEIISVPNQFVLSGNTVNYSTMAKQNQLILYTSVTIGYDAPWQTIHGLLINAALETDGIINDPRPFVFQNALNDFYVEYQINAYTNNAQKMAETYSNLHAKIQDKFNEAGVEIMSPHYNSLRDGNAIAIPDANKPHGYQSPAFKVKS